MLRQTLRVVTPVCAGAWRGRAVATLVLALASVAGASAQARWPSSNPPRPLAARDVKFPPYHLQTLPNGLQVVAVLHHEQPVISMRMIVRAGGALDPKGKNGLAELAASVLTQGAGGRSANQLQDTVDFMGAALGAGAGTDLSFVNMIVMKDSFETGLRILSDVARRPAFANEEIDRQRQQMLSGLQVSFESPEFIADSVFRRLVYGFHPYGMPQNGTPDTLAAITRDDLVAFHRRNFAPNNAILAIVGDVTDAEAFETVKKVFGDWEQREIPATTFVAPPEPTRRIVVINKPDAVQTEVRVGHLGVRRGHTDYMPLNLATRILGGEGANRLHQVLRTERGLTYGASADFDTLKETGAFEASTNTRTDATGEVLRLIVDEFWKLQRERVGERELADAKAYLTGSFPLTIETPDAIATQVLNVLFYGLPVEQLESFRQRVNAVSVDEVERVARFFLRPDRLSIVLVGNVAAFEGQLRRLGFDKFETIEMTNLDLTTADFKKPPRLGRAEPTDGNVLRSSFDVRRAPFSVLGSTFSVRGATFDVPRSSFTVPRSPLSVRAAYLDRTMHDESGTTNDTRRTENAARRTENAARRTENAARRTTNAEPLTTNAERRTSNAERRTTMNENVAQTASPVVAEEGAAALALVDKAIAAKGGLDTLRAVKSITAVTHASMATPEGRVEAKTTTYLQYPNRMRVETQLADTTIIQTFDGTRAFVKDRSGTHEVPERMIRDLVATFKRDTIAALLAAHDKQLRARLLPNVKDDAGQVHQAVELSGSGLDPLVLYIDAATSQVVKLAYVVNGPGQPLVEEVFSDHKPVDGVQVAFSASVRQAGRAVLERKIIDIKINTPLDASLFQRPAS